jgi:hypothetical protein
MLVGKEIKFVCFWGEKEDQVKEGKVRLKGSKKEGERKAGNSKFD